MPLSFSSCFAKSEQSAVETLLSSLSGPFGHDAGAAAAAKARAAALITDLRAQKRPAGQLESFLRQYSLSTEEGLALMTLAEALLRIPDAATARRLIHDKVAAANWLSGAGRSNDWIVKAAGLGLFMSSKTLDSVIARVGEPFLHQAMVQAIGLLGKQFVLGEDIEAASQNAQKLTKKGYRLSYDILGEGARTAIDAEHYFDSYANAIHYIGERLAKTKDEGSVSQARRPGISVKLSALHPRYEYAQSARCIPEMSLRLKELARLAASYNIPLTVDAEECERLDTSVKIIEDTLFDKELAGWEGFGLAVQAYHKAALPLIDHMAQSTREASRRLQMRLVKGAYWDTEIKLAQVRGLEDFPVYTRKKHTDLSYLACAHKMFGYGDFLYPMMATHNAHTIASVLEIAERAQIPYEFQRLFGMGEGLYDLLMEREDVNVCIYAPVGPYKDLLPYLVRRLLENGANSSFVNKIMNPDEPVDYLVRDPVDETQKTPVTKHPRIALPKDLFIHEPPAGRLNSAGLDLHAPEVVQRLTRDIERASAPPTCAPLIGGKLYKDSVPYPVYSPARTDEEIGQYHAATAVHIGKAYESAREGFARWNALKAESRAAALERAADLLEHNRAALMSLLTREAGKTIPDALDELREAVDFCRYYANQGRALFASGGQTLPGPTGEYNALRLGGRGAFVCISPWNFPLAIFMGQITAALMAGNTVLAKPAEQTPLIALRAVQILHEAGVPAQALHLLPGDGRVGEQLVDHRNCAGVAFTGSTDTARSISRALADKKGPLVPLIAETGGQNAMIVDSSALPEQVIDDVIGSAFGSAGQRCSALRILCLQNDTADIIIRMLKGRMAEMTLGDPALLATDIGPVIDEGALANLTHHLKALEGFGDFIAQSPMDPALPIRGHFFAPCAYEIKNLHGLTREVFGPVLHIVRYEKEELDDLLEQIEDTGYGLTLGIHSRIKSFQNEIIARMPVGNIYVNRGITGAIVGSQPFGGMGLSGTGPKAGGPHYLLRFAHEKALSVNTAAAGGNASLVTLADEPHDEPDNDPPNDAYDPADDPAREP